MKHIKSTLIASAALFAFAASPALAGDKAYKNQASVTPTAASFDAVANLSAADRMTWETKIKANMSAEKKAKWATLTTAEQNALMDKKIAKKMTKASMATTTQVTATPNDSTQVLSSSEEAMIGKVLQTEGEPAAMNDKKLLMADGERIEKSKLIAVEADNNAANNAIVVPTVGAGPEVLTTVACPIGTTAQPDMTCHVTGDYQPSS
ncbi:hypothetical protein N9M10_03120 [Hellea sp.]|nr:hypothetical protein [Hellea sp.]